MFCLYCLYKCQDCFIIPDDDREMTLDSGSISNSALHIAEATPKKECSSRKQFFMSATGSSVFHIMQRYSDIFSADLALPHHVITQYDTPFRQASEGCSTPAPPIGFLPKHYVPCHKQSAFHDLSCIHYHTLIHGQKHAASVLQYGMVPKEQKRRNHLGTTITKHAVGVNKPVIGQY